MIWLFLNSSNFATSSANFTKNWNRIMTERWKFKKFRRYLVLKMQCHNGFLIYKLVFCVEQDKVDLVFWYHYLVIEDFPVSWKQMKFKKNSFLGP